MPAFGYDSDDGVVGNLQAVAPPPPPPPPAPTITDAFAQMGYGTRENFEILKYAVDQQLSV